MSRKVIITKHAINRARLRLHDNWFAETAGQPNFRNWFKTLARRVLREGKDAGSQDEAQFIALDGVIYLFRLHEATNTPILISLWPGGRKKKRMRRRKRMRAEEAVARFVKEN